MNDGGVHLREVDGGLPVEDLCASFAVRAVAS